MPRSAKW